MKRNVLGLLFIMLLISNLGADTAGNKLLFMEYGIDYAVVIDPEEISNNNSGVYDTPEFNAKVGGTIHNWVDLYLGVSFLFFADRQDTSQHYTFINSEITFGLVYL